MSKFILKKILIAIMKNIPATKLSELCLGMLHFLLNLFAYNAYISLQNSYLSLPRDDYVSLALNLVIVGSLRSTIFTHDGHAPLKG